MNVPQYETFPGDSESPQEYIANTSFDDLQLSSELRRAITECGYVSPTPVQARAFHLALAGKDLIVRSKTGTGKTAAFGMPIIERIPMGTREVQALVLCPTRELALQVTQALSALASHRDVKATTIYGGASMKQQEEALKMGHAIIVGTPGRVYDFIRRGVLDLRACAHVVLDEADEMLDQGFYETVSKILDCLPMNRQVLLFSATLPESIHELIARYTKNAETLLLSGDVYTVEHIRHIRHDVSDAYPKPRNLLYLLAMHEPNNAIIFCNTRDDTSLVTAVLNRNGFDAETLNGDLPQQERERVMARVKRGELALMVATDLAARGIDISDLGYVINYSLPEDAAVYLHRVGRTGRIGKSGIALNLVSGKELGTLSTLEKKYGVHFEYCPMPSAEEAISLWTERHVRQLKNVAQDSNYEGFLPVAANLKARDDADDLIAIMLKDFFSRQHKRHTWPLQETSTSPKTGASVQAQRQHSKPKDDTGTSTAKRKPRGRTREKLPERSVRFWLNLGREDGISHNSLAEVLGVSAHTIQKTDLRDTFAYVHVQEADGATFEALTGKAYGDKTLKVERARARTRTRTRR